MYENPGGAIAPLPPAADVHAHYTLKSVIFSDDYYILLGNVL